MLDKKEIFQKICYNFIKCLKGDDFYYKNCKKINGRCFWDK